MAWTRILGSILSDIADALREKGASGGSAGKNKFDKNNYSVIKAYLAANETQWLPDSSSSSARISCKPNTTYTISVQDTSVTLLRVAVTDSEAVPAASKPVTVYNEVRRTNTDPITVTTGANAKYIVVQMNNGLFTSAAEGLQMEEGATATSFEPYHAVFKPQEMAAAIRGLDVEPPLMMSSPMMMSMPGSEDGD